MIQITAYLRDEKDLQRWKALPNKVQFIHDALQGTKHTVSSTPDKVQGIAKIVDDSTHTAEYGSVKPGKVPNKPIKTKEEALEQVQKVFPNAKPVTYQNKSSWGA